MPKKVNTNLFFPTSKRQDFIYPRVLTESKRYPGCWRIKFTKYQNDKGGYSILYEGELWNAVRLSFHLNVKNIPRKSPNQKNSYDGTVRHNCGNSWCVNPKHLYMLNDGQVRKHIAKKEAEKQREKFWEKSPLRMKNGRKPKKRTWQTNGKGHGLRGRSNLGVSFWLLMRNTIYWGA